MNLHYLYIQRTEKNIQFKNCILCIDKSHPLSKTGFLGFDQICECGAAVALATVVKEMGVGNSIFSCGDECKEFKGTLRNCCEVVTVSVSFRNNLLIMFNLMGRIFLKINPLEINSLKMIPFKIRIIIQII